jgi:biopolymer transport protein ExbB
MSGLAPLWQQADAVGRAVALLLLAMSVATWVLIFWKSWLLRRARHDAARGIAAYWAAPTPALARERLAAIDRERILLPLLDAAEQRAADGALEARQPADAQLTRRLRGALVHALAHLRQGQVVLASVGATAPFVGLFGTVWGIYHALVAIAAAGTVTIDRVSGPVGEALVLTAAGLAVAIPAVLAYNVHGQWAAALEAELEGYAHDLRALAPGAQPPA